MRGGRHRRRSTARCRARAGRRGRHAPPGGGGRRGLSSPSGLDTIDRRLQRPELQRRGCAGQGAASAVEPGRLDLGQGQRRRCEVGCLRDVRPGPRAHRDGGEPRRTRQGLLVARSPPCRCPIDRAPADGRPNEATASTTTSAPCCRARPAISGNGLSAPLAPSPCTRGYDVERLPRGECRLDGIDPDRLGPAMR